MDATEVVKAEQVQKFWDAYRACVEARHIAPQRSGNDVRWGNEDLSLNYTA